MIRLSVNIDVADKGWTKAFTHMQKKIEQAASCAFLSAKKPSAFQHRHFDINIILTNDANIRKLNKIYRRQNKATNVLSFPQFALPGLKKQTLSIYPAKSIIPLGDVVLARGTILKECKRQKKTAEQHMLHLVVHGVLHLLGYDHMRHSDAKNMEKLECDILSVLGYPDPYHEHTPKQKKRRHG